MQRNVNKIYFDLCDNIKDFFRFDKIENKKNKFNNNKLYKLMKKIKYKIYTKFNLINELNEFNEYILYTRNIKKSIKKIEKIFYYLKKNDYKIIVSDYFIKELKCTNSYIINKVLQYNKEDKTIFNKQILNTVRYVITIKEENEQENNIYVIVEEYNEKIKDMLLYFVKNYKSLNIITNNIREYRNFEEKVYSKYEIPVIISNNKRKALARAKYIVNIGFNEQELNEYIINREAIIFNISNNIIKKIRGFEGIIINNIEVERKSHKLKGRNFIDNRFISNIEDIKISSLLGNNGKISFKEFGKNIY